MYNLFDGLSPLVQFRRINLLIFHSYPQASKRRNHSISLINLLKLLKITVHIIDRKIQSISFKLEFFTNFEEMFNKCAPCVQGEGFMVAEIIRFKFMDRLFLLEVFQDLFLVFVYWVVLGCFDRL